MRWSGAGIWRRGEYEIRKRLYYTHCSNIQFTRNSAQRTLDWLNFSQGQNLLIEHAYFQNLQPKPMLWPLLVWACSAYKPYFFSQRSIFFFHTKSANNTFSHGLLAKQARTRMNTNKFWEFRSVFLVKPKQKEGWHHQKGWKASWIIPVLESNIRLCCNTLVVIP